MATRSGSKFTAGFQNAVVGTGLLARRMQCRWPAPGCRRRLVPQPSQLSSRRWLARSVVGGSVACSQQLFREGRAISFCRSSVEYWVLMKHPFFRAAEEATGAGQPRNGAIARHRREELINRKAGSVSSYRPASGDRYPAGSSAESLCVVQRLSLRRRTAPANTAPYDMEQA